MDKLGRNPVNRKILPLFLLILLALAGGILPLSLMGLQQQNLNLYYESSTASAPVDLTFYGSVSEYSSERLFLNMMRGVWRGYRSISGSVTLKIGAHYQETITVKPTVERLRGTPETYSCSISAEFSVPASTVVPYMELSGDTTDQGSSSFTASYNVSISADPSDVVFSGETTGPVYIQIVGEVSDYVVEDPPGEDPPEEAPPEDLPLQDSKDVNDQGGSEITSSTVSGFLAQISIPLVFAVTIIIGVLFYYRRK